ncbi:MAG: ABC transporter permease [Coriobacteriales bacterium]|jgi:ABC-2 type transport system permease protein|nr:ABC transporter permease [Coriobacteriales bacterium]
MNEIIEQILAGFGAAVVVAVVILVCATIPRIRRYLPALKQYRHLLSSLVARDLKVKYRRSALGVAWSVINPLFMMLIVTFVFSQVFRIQVENYPIFYLTGSIVYTFVNEATNSSMNSIIANAGLIKKVYIPKYLFPLQACITAAVNASLSLVAVAIVFAVFQAPLHFTLFLTPVPLLYAGVFSLGLGLILSALVVYFRDIAHIYGIWCLAWFYVTPILYPLSILPDFAQTILLFNPLVHFVNYSRAVMLDGIVPGLQENLICLGFALSTLTLGILVFKRAQEKFILYL